MKFDGAEISKNKVHSSKHPIEINKTDVDNIIMSYKMSYIDKMATSTLLNKKLLIVSDHYASCLHK